MTNVSALGNFVTESKKAIDLEARQRASTIIGMIEDVRPSNSDKYLKNTTCL